MALRPENRSAFASAVFSGFGMLFPFFRPACLFKIADNGGPHNLPDNVHGGGQVLRAALDFAKQLFDAMIFNFYINHRAGHLKYPVDFLFRLCINKHINCSGTNHSFKAGAWRPGCCGTRASFSYSCLDHISFPCL